MSDNNLQTHWNSSEEEQANRNDFYQLFRNAPLPPNEMLQNLALFIKRQDLSSMLFMIDMYKEIIETHGVIMEFGVRWGRNLALFSALRGLLEPFNHNRKIIGFDTWEGFPSVHPKDGSAEIIAEGSFNVTPNYEDFLAQVLDYHESESPIAHIKKYELRKGDAVKQIDQYLEENPHTIVAMAYFDFDIYEPTKACLNKIKDRLTKGSVIGFDELNVKNYPGEMKALQEVFGLDKYKIRRTPYSGAQSYIVIE